MKRNPIIRRLAVVLILVVHASAVNGQDLPPPAVLVAPPDARILTEQLFGSRIDAGAPPLVIMPPLVVGEESLWGLTASDVPPMLIAQLPGGRGHRKASTGARRVVAKDRRAIVNK
jgi:hypothetical protein